MIHQTSITIPSFTGKINSGSSETKQESLIRNDLYASSRYAKRPMIDRYNEDKALKRALREMEL